MSPLHAEPPVEAPSWILARRSRVLLWALARLDPHGRAKHRHGGGWALHDSTHVHGNPVQCGLCCLHRVAAPDQHLLQLLERHHQHLPCRREARPLLHPIVLMNPDLPPPIYAAPPGEVLQHHLVVSLQLHQRKLLHDVRREGAPPVAAGAEAEQPVVAVGPVAQEGRGQAPVEGCGEDALHTHSHGRGGGGGGGRGRRAVGDDQETVSQVQPAAATGDGQVTLSGHGDLSPGMVSLSTRAGASEAEAPEAALGILPGESKGAQLAGGALPSFHGGLALAGAQGTALAEPPVVALVLLRALRVAVARSAVGKVVVAPPAPVALGSLEAVQAATPSRLVMTLVGHRAMPVTLAQLEEEEEEEKKKRKLLPFPRFFCLSLPPPPLSNFVTLHPLYL